MDDAYDLITFFISIFRSFIYLFLKTFLYNFFSQLRSFNIDRGVLLLIHVLPIK